MGFFFVLVLFLCCFCEAQQITSPHLLDLLIRDYTFRSYRHHTNRFTTGELIKLNLPANFSGVEVDFVRFRCGSLRRYGGAIKEFHLGIGVLIRPCNTRVMLIRHKLGSNWSSIYYRQLSGYRLISPVIGLLAYSIGNISPVEVEIEAGESPISVDFRTLDNNYSSNGLIPLCAGLEEDGEIRISQQSQPGLCTTRVQGHFGLVVEAPLIPEKEKEKIVGKAAIGGGCIGAILGICLLGLLVIALLVNGKKNKARKEEMERRAYEEEALRVSMVGHVASRTRTTPTIHIQNQSS